jgi:hypothetical protein
MFRSGLRLSLAGLVLGLRQRRRPAGGSDALTADVTSRPSGGDRAPVIGVASVATWFRARAASVDPVIALRAD